MSANEKDEKEEMTAKKFITNYQAALNNYLNGVKYFQKYKQMIEDFEKVIAGYKDLIKDSQKKLSQLRLSLKKAFYLEEKKTYKYDNKIYPNINNHFEVLNNIFQFQLDLYTKELSDLETNNIFKINNKKTDSVCMNTLNQNGKNLGNEKKNLEKLINEYDNEYEKLDSQYDSTEECLKKNLLKKDGNNNDDDELQDEIKKTTEIEKKYHDLSNKFQEKNDNYFKMYENYIKALEKEISQNSNDLNKNVNLFLSLINNNYKYIHQKLDVFNKAINLEANINTLNASKAKEKPEENKSTDNEKEKENQEENKTPNKEKETSKENKDNKNNLENINEEEIKANEDFNLFKNKNFKSFEQKYIKPKYTIKAVEEKVIDDKLGSDKKQIMNDLNEILNLDDCFEEGIIVLPDEVVYEIANKFYEKFEFVDKSEYNLTIEKEKIKIKNLTQRLLRFGYEKKKYKEFSQLEEIKDEELTQLLNSLKTSEYRLSFLRVLNNFRALGVLDFPKKEYDITSNYFKAIADNIADEKEKDIQSIRLLLILSQTFYITVDGAKHFLQKDLCGHKIFQDKDFWAKYLKDNIETELDKIRKNQKKNNIPNAGVVNKDIAFGSILPFGDNMMGFGMSKEVVMEILTPFYKEYEIPEDMQQSIEGIIDSKVATPK